MTSPREIEYSGQFQKDVKKIQKRHKDMNKLKTLMTLLINDKLPLPAAYKDQQRLQGCAHRAGLVTYLQNHR